MLALQPVSPARANADSGSPDLGRQLFFEGRQDGRDPLTANVGAASVPVPATALPCAGCHGRDGQGRPEGGVRPSDITWFNLSREYGGVTAKGRRFQVYDEDRFLRAVSEGFDSSGNQLDSSMPRYNISRRDARDLIAYLKVIQDDFDPGVSDDAIVFATVQPTVSAQSRVGDAMVEVMRARFDEVNREGGVYGKQLRLEVLPFED
ncbi:MAG: c-type cytochrome, partial [Gammaproteobacteria bacterium]|nr:c-type cytochrome [Gammaproteobacteria bacterium]